MAVTQTLSTLTADQLHDERTSGTAPILINTLGADAFQARRIPGSINVPTDDIDVVTDIVPDRDASIVVYCANEDCTASSEAARKLEDLGYTNVRDFETGYEAGYEAGRQAGYDLLGQEG